MLKLLDFISLKQILLYFCIMNYLLFLFHIPKMKNRSLCQNEIFRLLDFILPK